MTYNGNSYNTTPSEPAVLTVLPAAEITQNVTGTITVKAGETVNIHVGAEGTGLTYQWMWAKFKGVWKNTTMNGATTDTLSFTATKEMNGRYYMCIITNDGKGQVSTGYVQMFVE